MKDRNEDHKDSLGRQEDRDENKYFITPEQAAREKELRAQKSTNRDSNKEKDKDGNQNDYSDAERSTGLPYQGNDTEGREGTEDENERI